MGHNGPVLKGKNRPDRLVKQTSMKKSNHKLQQLLEHLSQEQGPDKTHPDKPLTSANQPGERPPLGEAAIRRLMQLLEKTQEEELTCQETFALLDEYVELVDSNAEMAALMPIVRLHLDMCPDCHNEFEALLRILQTEPRV